MLLFFLETGVKKNCLKYYAANSVHLATPTIVSMQKYTFKVVDKEL